MLEATNASINNNLLNNELWGALTSTPQFINFCLATAAVVVTAAAEDDKKRDDDEPYALVVENVAKAVIHIFPPNFSRETRGMRVYRPLVGRCFSLLHSMSTREI